MASESIAIVVDPIIEKNPITFQILGLCSALAVTTSLMPTFLMSVAVTCVLAIGGAVISLIREHIPDNIRIVVQMTIVASLVIVADQVMQAYVFDLSRQLSVFVGLIVTNCIVLGRIESFAMKNGVVASFLDGLGNGIGYSLALVVIATIRELLGSGSLLGYTIFPTVANGGWYEPNGMALLSPGVFLIIGLLIWAIRSSNARQREQPEFRIRPNLVTE